MAACNVCNALTNRREWLNQRCYRVVNGRRCYGTFKSAVSFLWDECEGCRATGMVGSEICSQCSGFGWRLYC